MPGENRGFCSHRRKLHTLVQKEANMIMAEAGKAVEETRRKLDKTREMDDGLLYILAAGQGKEGVQTRALDKYGGGCPTHNPDVSYVSPCLHQGLRSIS